MEPGRWQVVRQIFEAAAPLGAKERRALLDERCGDDRELRREVEELLAEDESDDLLLEPPPAGEAPWQIGQPEEDLAAGTQVGTYKVLELIASGGMGSVYRAERADEAFDKVVALKVIKRGMDSEEILQRFHSERRVLALLEHPWIARLLDGGITRDGRSFLVMEYVDGAAIDRYCDQQRLAVEQRLQLFLKVCDAVQSAHERLVVHRDLKPGNILVAAGGIPKLLDFGIAKVLDPEAVDSAATLGPSQLLTPEYASPEQVRGEPISTASDVYSLGVVLYELLTGTRPHSFAGKSRTEIERTLGEEPVRMPSSRVLTDRSGETQVEAAALRGQSVKSLARRVGGDLDNVALKALHPERDRRYGTVEELAADLRRHLNGFPVLARPDGLGYRIGKFLKRNRVAVTIAALVLAAMTAAVVVSTSSRSAAVKAQAETQRQLAEVLRFSDATLIRDLAAREKVLWPAWPHRLGDMSKWITEAARLLERRILHEEQREQLASERRADPDVATSPEWRWRQQTTQEVLAGLTELEQLHAAVAERRSAAETLRQRSIEVPAQVWEEAMHEVFLSETYDGLELEPQMGLVPLGPDPDSGLWEFCAVETGEVPPRDPETGALAVAEETGLVFVLLPANEVWIGAQPDDEEGPNFDPLANPDEVPVLIELDAFFLSKYEITQAQWQRMAGENPSFFAEGWIGSGAGVHPVDNVSWGDCTEILERSRLALPTEAQWEYGARGGATTPWWSGEDPASLDGCANLADRRHAKDWVSQASLDKHLDDGYGSTSPVGTYRANGFGLHDTMGNLFEICRDFYGSEATIGGKFEWNVDLGDGLRRPIGEGLAVPDDPAERNHMFRGGAFGSDRLRIRSAFRARGPLHMRANYLGVRPSRAILPPDQ